MYRKAHQNMFNVIAPDVKIVRGQPSVAEYHYPLINILLPLLIVRNVTLKIDSNAVMTDNCT